MREIKYRAWLKEEKRMVNVEDISLDYQQISYKPFKEEDLEFQEHLKTIMPGKFQGCLSSSLFKEIELMQYTGLKDKNGVDIYEGDIIKIPNDYDEYGWNAGEKYEVIFKLGGFRLAPKYKSKANGYWLENDGEFEVVGNIYENEDLIRG